MSETGDDDASSLDALLGKYGSSGRSVKLAEAGESSTDDRQDHLGHQEEPSSQFLLEIRERAKILSRNTAKSRKAALQNVVNDGSQSTSEGGSLDLFMDIIRSTAIPDEAVAPSTSSLPESNEEELTPYSGDDLLQSVVPLDTAPWNTAEDDTLNTSQSYYQGIDIKPWGESTAEVCDDASEDSDSSCEESQDSDCSDVDGAGFVTTSREIAGDLPHEMDTFDLKSDFETDEDDKRGVEDSKHASSQLLWQAEAVKDSGMATPRAREEAAARRDEEDIDRDDDEDEEGDDCCEEGNDEVNMRTRCHVDQSSGHSKLEDEVEDVSPLGSTKMSRDENVSEEEDKMKNALSNQQTDLTPDVCYNLVDGNTEGSTHNIDNEVSVNNDDDEGSEDQSSQLFELSEDDEHDATTVQQRVSSALDDMLGEVFREERIPHEDEGDGGESDLRPRSPVAREGEDSQGQLQSPDKTSLAQEEPCGTRQDESVSDVLSLQTKSYSSQQMGQQLEVKGDEDGDHHSSNSPSPSESPSSRNHSEEKNAEYFSKKSTEIGSKDGTDFVEVKEINSLNQGLKPGPIAISHSPRSDEETVEQSGVSETAEPRCIEHNKSKPNDAMTEVDLRDQDSETIITAGSLSLPQAEADISICSADAVSTAEKQPVISKSGHPQAKEESVSTSISQDMPKPDAGSDATTRKSDRPPILLGEAKTPHKQERKWSPRTDDPSSSPRTSQTANHGHNLAVGNKPIRCRQWGQSGPRESSKPSSPDVVSQQRDGTLEAVEETKGPGNVRGLIARFNSGSACSSPVESSPRGERVQAFDWSTFPLRGKLTTAGRTTDTGVRNRDEKMHSSQQRQDRNSSDEGTVNSQDIPWMRELRERRKRRGKAPP